jgi:hypothetical protein
MSIDTHLLLGWFGMLMGVISGAIIGMFFAKEQWLGGYGSFQRRMLRLGHLAFFGIGFLNLMFAFSLPKLELGQVGHQMSSWGFAVALSTMSLTCFLSAWRKPMRHLFPIPVTGALTGIIGTLSGLI